MNGAPTTFRTYAEAAQEDRCAPRRQGSIPATLRAAGTRAFPTVVHDLSLGGFCCTSISRLHPDTICWLTLPGLESLQSRVVWWEASQVGCAFDNLLNPIVLETMVARWLPEAAPRGRI